LSQPKAAHGLSDFDDQTRFDLEFLRVGQAKVGIHVAGTALHFDTVNGFFHFECLVADSN
jgi:hypothetical protein